MGKIPTKFVAQIKRYCTLGYGDTELGRAFGVDRKSIASIRSGKHHARVIEARSVPDLDKAAAAIRAMAAPPVEADALRQAPLRSPMASPSTPRSAKSGLTPLRDVPSQGIVAEVLPTPQPARPVPERHGAPPEPSRPPVTALDAPTAASVVAEAAPQDPDYLIAARGRHAKALEEYAEMRRRPFLGPGELDKTEREAKEAAESLQSAYARRNASA